MPESQVRVVSCAVTIQRAAEDLYAYWENAFLLPSILRHLHGKFEQEDEHPDDTGIGVTALALTQRIPPRLLEWVARVHGEVLYRGLASFRPAPSGRGTELRFSLELSASSGALKRALDRLIGREPTFLLREDLRNFKQFMETGEYPTTRGQPAGRRSLRGRALTAVIGERLQRELAQSGAEARPPHQLSPDALEIHS
jgi:uncharacterized membrane protein